MMLCYQRWVAVRHRLPRQLPRPPDLHGLRAAAALGAAVPAGDQRSLEGTRRHQTPGHLYPALAGDGCRGDGGRRLGRGN
jgi:hypothetical protein